MGTDIKMSVYIFSQAELQLAKTLKEEEEEAYLYVVKL